MLAAFDDPGVGAAGPRIRNLDGSVYPSARRNPGVVDAAGHGVFARVWPGNPFTRRYRDLDADGYFMYVEDVDVGWRLRAAGWRIRYEPAGEVTHHQGLSTDRHPARTIVDHHQSLYRFARKRWRGPKRVLLVPAAVFLTVRATFSVLLNSAVPTFRPRSGSPETTL